MKAKTTHQLQRAIRDYIPTLKRQTVVEMLSTYLIFDPTEEDHLNGSPFGVPFYVGQGDFVARAKSHLRGASGRVTRKRIATIYEKGRHPLFFVVDRARTRLISLKSEMDWACYLIRLGYSLTNDWREHKSPEPLSTVPAKRVWQFTVEEAIADCVGMRVKCKGCGLSLSLPIDEMSWGDAAHTHLNQIRNTFICPECSAPRCLRIDVPFVGSPTSPDLSAVLEILRCDCKCDVVSGR
jgi:rubredoxin